MVPCPRPGRTTEGAAHPRKSVHPERLNVHQEASRRHRRAGAAGRPRRIADDQPGDVETTMTRTNPMTGTPTTETSTECVTEQSFDPREMMQDARGCQLTEENLSGDTLTFAMACTVEGAGSADIKGPLPDRRTDGQRRDEHEHETWAA
ncbi:MAG: DUF3617 family protein [Gammaproteobacteria bacterium]|nr:DUF3617 family protein [Gammaproteobacteria bacterium]